MNVKIILGSTLSANLEIKEELTALEFYALLARAKKLLNLSDNPEMSTVKHTQTKTTLPEETIKRIKEMLQSGIKPRVIAKTLGIKPTCAYYYQNKLRGVK